MGKYKVSEPNKLSSWRKIAEQEIYWWLNDEEYRNEVTKTTMVGENMGEFTKFMYYFAGLCDCELWVMLDFDQKKQTLTLTEEYYNFMARLIYIVEEREIIIKCIETSIGGKVTHVSHNQNFNTQNQK